MNSKLNANYDYDIALSYASENLEYVDQVAALLLNYGVRVFYDRFEEADLWGKNLYEHLNDIYKNKCKYTIMFISQYYGKKMWPTLERKSIQERAFRESSDYILPARFDDTEIPGLFSTISYINLIEKTPSELVNIVLKKLKWQIKNRWWGIWQIESWARSYNGILEIYSVGELKFNFRLITENGAHMGEVKGIATFLSTTEAAFKKKEFSSFDECVLKFTKINDVIQISENTGCSQFRGMRAHLGGTFKLKKDVFYNFDFIKDITLTKMYKLLKRKYWEEYLKCFGDIHYPDNLDNFSANIISGAVAGLYNVYESILIVDSDQNVYGAFLNVNKIYYFTSNKDFKRSIPKSIDKWKENFITEEIKYLD